MAFKVLDRKYDFGENEGGKSPAQCDILCDTSADLPTAKEIEEENISPGSWAWIANEKTYAVLNNQMQWQKGAT